MNNIMKSCHAFLLFIAALPFSSLATQGSQLSVSISGHIESYCEIDFTDGVKMDFSNEAQKVLPFDIQCNQPLSMSVYSRNGGLQLLKSKQEILTPYEVNIDITSLGLNQTLLSREISSPRIINSSNVIPFNTDGVMRVTLEENLLYAGYYEDVIEIDVFPSIHGSGK